MTNLTRWNPARELWSLTEDMNRFVSSVFGDMTQESTFLSGEWHPLLDIGEDRDNFYITLDLPGMTKSDVHVNYEAGILTVRGERKPAWQDSDKISAHTVERRFGRFERSLTVPRRIIEDRITATFKNGVLTITLPKAEDAKRKEIEVKVS